LPKTFSQFLLGIGANLGYFTLSGDDFQGVDAAFGFEAFGWYSLAIGGIGGLLLRVGPQVTIETSVLFATVSVADWEIDGETVENSDTDGSTLAVQAGVVVPFPR